MNVILLLGAPGSGKGTVSERLRDHIGYIHVSTGDMLRAAVKNATEVGKEAEGYMKSGALVPDEIMIKLVEDLLDEKGSDKSYMFDGFPRTINQAELLEKSLEGRGGAIDHVFLLETPVDVLMVRLTGRRICRQCSTNYHIKNLPPKVEGVCDACGGELYHRPDDHAETIENRLEVYRSQTESLISRYQDQGILKEIDSNRTADYIVKDIDAVLNSGE